MGCWLSFGGLDDDNWHHGFRFRLWCKYSILLFFESLFGRATIWTTLKRGFFARGVGALDTYKMRPSNLDLFFLDLSALIATPHCSPFGGFRKLHRLNSDLLFAKERTLATQLCQSGCSGICL